MRRGPVGDVLGDLIGDDAIDAGGVHCDPLLRVVDRPGHDANTGSVEFADDVLVAREAGPIRVEG